MGDFISQKYTRNTVNDLKNELDILKQNLVEKNAEKSKEQIETINNKWDEFHTKLAYYIEHNELEKVETGFISSTSLIDTQEYDLAINEIDKTVFLLEHIEDRYTFNLENIL